MSTSKVSTSSCLWTPNSAYTLLMEHVVLESFNTTPCRAASSDFSGCSRPDVPFDDAETLHCWCRQDRRDTVPHRREVARTRLCFTQPEWACLKDIFTGISNQSAVVLWGQTEINDRHDPINACVISNLNSWQIKTEWAIFVTCIFLPLKSSLLTGQIMFTYLCGSDTEARE